MGIFEDEAAEMYKETHDAISKKAVLEAEQHGLAHIVSDDLARYIAFAHLSGIEQSVDGNHVKVRLVANNNTLDIICEKEDAFKISTSHGDFHDVLTKKEMARHVLKWLGR